MKLVTVATHSERYFPYLKLSAEKYGHDLVVLGWGKKWEGYTWKLLLMKEYLRGVADNELVCFIDGFDVIVLQSPDKIEAAYFSQVNGNTNKVLVSKEQYSNNGSPNILLNLLGNLIFTKCHGEYINSGTYMGTASRLLYVLEDLCKEFTCAAKTNDQLLLSDYCAKHYDLFVIDNNCEVFLVISSTLTSIQAGQYDITIRNGELMYKKEIYPGFFHGNGFTNFDYIIKELGYDPSLFKASGENKQKFIWNVLAHYVPIALSHIWFFLICLVVFYIYRKPLFKFMRGRVLLARRITGVT